MATIRYFVFDEFYFSLKAVYDLNGKYEGRTCMYVLCMYVCMYVCMYNVCMYVCMCVLCMYELCMYYVCTYVFPDLPSVFGDRGNTVVEVLCYESEGRWFDPSWCQ